MPHQRVKTHMVKVEFNKSSEKQKYTGRFKIRKIRLSKTMILISHRDEDIIKSDLITVIQVTISQYAVKENSPKNDKKFVNVTNC